jgi:hypothetical protein
VGLDHIRIRRTPDLLTVSADYARTCREWDKRFVANVTPEILEKDFPSIKTDPAMFETLYRKWRYLFAYAEAGMGSGYVTCHMFTFIRPVCALYIWSVFELTDAYSWNRMINRPNDDYRRIYERSYASA